MNRKSVLAAGSFFLWLLGAAWVSAHDPGPVPSAPTEQAWNDAVRRSDPPGETSRDPPPSGALSAVPLPAPPALEGRSPEPART